MRRDAAGRRCAMPPPAINLRRSIPPFRGPGGARHRRSPPVTAWSIPRRITSIPRRGSGPAITLRRGRRTLGLRWSGVAYDRRQAGLAGLVSAQGDVRPPAGTAPADERIAERHRDAGRAGQPAGRAGPYLWKDNRDTLFRIHGTFEPWTIGKSVSSGCIRMINQDAMHLYGRIDVGTKVVVLSPLNVHAAASRSPGAPELGFASSINARRVTNDNSSFEVMGDVLY